MTPSFTVCAEAAVAKPTVMQAAVATADVQNLMARLPV